MDIDEEAKKVVWSLQNNKRSEDERNVFKPTGKKPMNKNIIYVLTSVVVLMLLSFLLTQFNTEEKEFCFLLDSLCYSSSDDKSLYVLYTFLNLLIIIIGFFVAYVVGKKTANIFKI
ncbi:MAG: putative membrane protein [Flavobacterium sp.]|jgi:uncharacterized membrane protein